MLSDLRFALRTLRRSPGLLAAAVLATALGVGANTAIFSVIQSVLLRPLPYRDPSRLVMIWENNPVFKGFLAARLPVAGRNYMEWKRQSRSFSGMAAMEEAQFELTGTDKPEELPAVSVTSDFIPLLGRSAWRGRLFTAAETTPGKDQVVVLSYAFYQRRFAAGPEIIGRTLELNGKPYDVLGVLPADFHLPALFQGMDVRHPDVWVPLNDVFDSKNEGFRDNYLIGRLRDGVSITAARAEMKVISAGLEQQYPKLNTGFSASMFPLSAEDVSPATGRTVLALQVAVAFVLLIACANVANLLLARAAGRARETAIRAALGASRGRLVRQALGESLLLSAAGGVLGILLAIGAMAAIRALAPEDNYHFHEVGLNWMVLAFAIGVATLCGLFFGVVPALSASSGDLQETLTQDGRAGIGRPARRLRNALVVSEVALALILLAGAGLMLRSLGNVLGVNPGFSADHVLSMHIRLPDHRYSNPGQVKAFTGRLLERVTQIGGVESAGIATGLPLMDSLSVVTFRIEGQPAPPPGQQLETDTKTVSEDYFRTIGTPILRGRGFTRQDAEADDPHAVILTDSLARQIFPHGDAIGRGLVVGGASHGAAVTVVGIVPDTHEMGLDTPPRPEMFLPGRDISQMAFVVRTAREPMALAGAIGAAVTSIDKDQPVTDVKPLAEHLHGTTQQRRFDTSLFASFAALALVLAAVGLYGVLSYSVTLRTREIGVRMALGAQSGDVVRLVVRQGLLMALAGTLLGVAGAMLLTQLMQNLVFGTSASDPLTFAAVAVVLLLVAAAASYIPARRARRMDPIQALRTQ